jgi:hypothetical protein
VKFDLSDPDVRELVIDLFCQIKVGCHRRNPEGPSDADMITYPVEQLDAVTHIPRAGLLYDYIANEPLYFNSRRVKDELKIGKCYSYPNNVRTKNIVLKVDELWTYAIARERIPDIMNPIMDSIVKKLQDDVTEV